MRLLDFLFPPREDERLLRDTDEPTFCALVEPHAACQTDPAAIILLPFHERMVRAAIHEAKYHGSRHAFALLAAALCDYLRTSAVPGKTTVIIPVPLGRKRLRDRGFNQAERVARLAATSATIRVHTTLLVRVRETTSQVSLPRHERHENMRGAFGAAHVLSPEEQRLHYIVLDDVLTTGATLQAAIDALKDAGAQHVCALALAH